MNMQTKVEKANLIYALTVAAAHADLDKVLAEARAHGVEDMITRERCIERASEIGDEALAAELANREWPSTSTTEGRANRLLDVCAKIDDMVAFDHDEISSPMQGLFDGGSVLGLRQAPYLRTSDTELLLMLNFTDSTVANSLINSDLTVFVLGGEVEAATPPLSGSVCEIAIPLQQTVRNRGIDAWELSVGVIEGDCSSQLVLLISEAVTKNTNTIMSGSDNSQSEVFEMTALAAADDGDTASRSYSPVLANPSEWTFSCHPVAGSSACYLEFQAADEVIDRFTGRKVTVFIDDMPPIELGVVDETGFIARKLDRFPNLKENLKLEISNA
ncbi:hypothetical protein [Salinivibrio sp. HTSP]|uniref:hypothetical protein n=1 Tax=Salinivibrio sp. HTSP TaxID=2115977 RepID=UPI000E30BA67|nr:hypothetical protein [Salinivibrio sp. HTSP]